MDTVNTRSGERVRVLWVNETQGQVRHYPFDPLAERILPVDREIIRQEREERAKRRERVEARLLRAKGLTWVAVGREMGISATAARLIAHR